ncbi:hypothetical protein MBAV_003679 [Candidatus Magnetobacterium bavaricum]|uniref:DUF3800 domain-containing protein n=1 Tax=Candidatus Magnetobacterium bavaricum TaxID=29290 RepID=A0A0F3GQ54_9BACT|nr:hypothetical protein MBAV_003679 [Candidatus Magnetobacterium bavaricum]
MSVFLFLDESGQDRRNAPYEVLAGVSIKDSVLWSLIKSIHLAEEEFFGQRITVGTLELKAKKLLKIKTFKHAAQLPSFDPATRTRLAQTCLQKGIESKGKQHNNVTKEELTALAQAKLAFVKKLLFLCKKYKIKIFAGIIDKDAPIPETNYLRRDYSYLFERFFTYLRKSSKNQDEKGIVVFDELERSQCHMLVDQMSEYLKKTEKGRKRSSQIIPEPFFVHSDLTTAIQIADIAAYIISWGVRLEKMGRPERKELHELASIILNLRYKSQILGDDRKK